MKKIFLSLVFVSILLSGCSENKNTLSINRTKIDLVDIANTNEKAYLGLSFRESICEACGMLFPFEDKKERTFVMRDMMFPLDILWIDDDEIMGISENLEPEGHNVENLYSSKYRVNNVLEVNAGFTNKNNIKVGDKVKYNLIQKNED